MPTCPVCSYPSLEEPPRSPSGGGSYEICPSCGFQFGVDDDDKGISYETWRTRWTEKGLPWSSRGMRPPKGWDAKTQLATLTRPSSPPKKPVSRTRPLPAKSAKGRKLLKPKKPVKKAVRKKR